jgi:hypothetical protein
MLRSMYAKPKPNVMPIPRVRTKFFVSCGPKKIEHTKIKEPSMLTMTGHKKLKNFKNIRKR